MTTKRNLKKELCYYSYVDMEYGRDHESINYDCLITIIQELVDRVEGLEKDNEYLKYKIGYYD
jgi:hypothetical protein